MINIGISFVMTFPQKAINDRTPPIFYNYTIIKAIFYKLNA